MPIRDKRDDLIAWWTEVHPNHWLYVESPGNQVIAEVRAIAGCLWDALLADGTRARFRLRRRAVMFCEEGVLRRGILS